MRKRLILMVSLCLLMTLVTGCTMEKSTRLENLDLVLLLGLDVDGKGNLVVYQNNPVFYKVAKKNAQSLRTKATSLRQAIYQFNDSSYAGVVTGKMQVVIVSKKLLEKRSLISTLDSVYRDPKNAVNADIIATDNNVGDVAALQPQDKPRLAVYLKQLVDSSYLMKRSAKTTLQQFHYQTLEKGMTPFMPEIRIAKENAKIIGISLLNEEGKYAFSLNQKETPYFFLLRKDIGGSVPFHIKIPAHAINKKNATGELTFTLENAKYKLKTGYKYEHFSYRMKVSMNVVVNECTLRFDEKKDKKTLEAFIARQIQQNSESLIKKIQKHQVDPIGFGRYARAYQYQAWKNVQNDWGKAFSKAHIEVDPKVQILSFGATE